MLADTEEAASALLRCVVRDPDPANVGRKFSSAAVELALASYPGFTSTSPPGDGQVYGVFTPAYVDATKVSHVAVHTDGRRTEIAPAAQTLELASVPPFALPEPLPFGETRRVPLGVIAGARSGDKGGAANSQGNTVSLETEMTEGIKDSLTFESMINGFNYKVSVLRQAIGGKP